MVDTSFEIAPDERVGASDIPRTLRRNDDRASRTSASERAAGVIITGLSISFPRLVWFFLKCALAALPAVLLLAALASIASEAATQAFPWLTQIKLQIYVPQ